MTYPVQLGLIGAGYWGQNYINTIINLKNIHLKRIASKYSNLNKFKLQNCIFNSDWRDLIRCDDLDGVIIATRPYDHAKIAKAFIQKGIPVIIEKPLTLSKIDAEHLFNIAREKNSIVKIDHTYLYSPGFRKLKEVSRQEKNLLSLTSIGGNYGPFRKDVNALWDWAPHDLSMCIDIIGKKPIKIDAEYLKREIIEKVEASNIYIGLEFENKIKANINIGNLMDHKKRSFKLLFKDYSLEFNPINNLNIRRYPHNLEKSSLRNNSNNIQLIEYEDVLPLSVLVKEFADEIRCAKSNISEIELAVNVIKLIEEISNKLR